MLHGEAGVAESVALLRAGEVVGMPTETVYGLAADAFQPLALARIFEAKERPLSDPLIIHIPEVGWLDRVALSDDSVDRNLVERLAAGFWPGPLTILLPKHPNLPDLVTAGSEWVAVRVTSHPLFQEVMRQLGSPIAAPSANRFGRISPTTAEDVRMELGETIAGILDGGPSSHGMESTILTVREGRMEILRPGPITEDQLKEFGHVIRRECLVNTPGSLPGHYAPGKELQIIKKDINELKVPANSGVISFKGMDLGIDQLFARVEVLSPSGDLREAASNFYGALRRLDQSEVDMIFSESLPEEGIGVAIMDRLRRAEYGSKKGSGHQGDRC